MMETLLAAKHPLANRLLEAFEKLRPRAPDLKDYTQLKLNDVVKPSKTFSCKRGNKNHDEIGFDKYGRISHLKVGEIGTWADENNTLLQLRYRSYSLHNVNEFMKSYVKLNATWTTQDYGKPGLPEDVLDKFWETKLEEFYEKNDAHCSFALKLAFETAAYSAYGAPEHVWVTISFESANVAQANSIGDDKLSIDISIGMYNKTRTRLPESMFVRFEPFGRLGGKNGDIEWEACRLGQWVGTSDIVDGGSKHLYGVTDNGTRATNLKTNSIMSVSSLDSPVTTFGFDSAYPSSTHKGPDVDDFGTSFVLWDNLWGTNYVLWWPFESPPSEYINSATYFPNGWNTNFISRYQIEFSSK